MEIISFDEKNKVFRDQMGIPLSGSDALWYLLRAIEHISHTEEELFFLSHKLTQHLTDTQKANVSEEFLKGDYEKVKKFVAMDMTIGQLIAEARKCYR